MLHGWLSDASPTIASCLAPATAVQVSERTSPHSMLSSCHPCVPGVSEVLRRPCWILADHAQHMMQAVLLVLLLTAL